MVPTLPEDGADDDLDNMGGRERSFDPRFGLSCFGV